MQRKDVFIIILVLIIATEGGLLFFGKQLLSGMPTFPQDCLKKPDGYDRWDCLNPYFEKFTKTVSANAALAEALELTKQGVISDCHITAHTIGRANLEKHDIDMGQAFATCGFACIQGCMHGVMERYVQEKADPYRMLGEIQSACDSVGSRYPGPGSGIIMSKEEMMWSQCHHGIGHGLLQHGFFPLEDSVSVCNDFDHPHARNRCISGVMMENMNQYLSLEEGFLRQILPEVCAPLEIMKNNSTMYSIWRECVNNIAQGLMFYTGSDTERSRELCEGLLQQADTALCKDSVINIKETRNPTITDVPF